MTNLWKFSDTLEFPDEPGQPELAEGDLVVSQGIVKLRDGARVRYAGDEPEVSDSATSGLRPANARG